MQNERRAFSSDGAGIRNPKGSGKRKRPARTSGSGKRDKPGDSGTVLIFRQLCEQYRIPAPIQEHEFAKEAGRKWRIDWYFEGNGRRVALEVEGGVWSGGRHTTGKGFTGDMEKYNAMSCRGILLLRTTPDQLLTMQTVDNLRAAIYGDHS